MPETDVPVVPARFRLQWEDAQKAYVLLYPEGMVKLSSTAAAIIKLVDGSATIAQIIEKLQALYPGADLHDDVVEFLGAAQQRGWIEITSR